MVLGAVGFFASFLTDSDDDGSTPPRAEAEIPLLGGRKITLAEAESITPYDVPLPPTNTLTGELSGIYADPSAQVAYIWSTDLRLYAQRTTMLEKAAVARWRQVVRSDDDGPFVMTRIPGHAALAAEMSETEPASLSWHQGKVSIQLVSPAHSLAQLKDIAREVRTES